MEANVYKNFSPSFLGNFYNQIYKCIYIYIYIEREKDRESDNIIYLYYEQCASLTRFFFISKFIYL